MSTRNTHSTRNRQLTSALLPIAITFALSACGGGSSVRAAPPPAPTAPPPTGIGFTPTVANDATLVEHLVRKGIASVSVDPTVAEQTRRTVARAEQRIILDAAANRTRTRS